VDGVRLALPDDTSDKRALPATFLVLLDLQADSAALPPAGSFH
jgi:hypothetical protein